MNENLEQVLEQLDKQTLVMELAEFADRDECMKAELFLRHGDEEGLLEHARGVILSSIHVVTQLGFVEACNTNLAVDGAKTILQIADDKVDYGDILNAVLLCVVVLEEMMNLLKYCDDWSGHVGSTIGTAIEQIDLAVRAGMVNQGDGEIIFETVLRHAGIPKYDAWEEWRLALITAILPLCYFDKNCDEMRKYLLEHLNSCADGWCGDYEKGQLREMQDWLDQRYG